MASLRSWFASNLKLGEDRWSTLGLTAVLGFFIVSGVVAYLNVQVLRDNNRQLLHSHDVIVALDQLFSTTQDAETGQRGYLLTGNDAYLSPYESAAANAASEADAIAVLLRDNPTQEANLAQVNRHINAKLDELRDTIELRRSHGAAAALSVVNTNRGKAEMDAIRKGLEAMRTEETRLRALRLGNMEVAYQTAIFSGIVSAVLGLIITIAVFVLVRGNARARARQEWLQAGQVGLSDAMLGDKSIEQLSEVIMSFLAKYVGFQAGALFTGAGNQFNRTATLGVPGDAVIPERFTAKEGLLGQVASEGRAQLLQDIPQGYLTIGSGLGSHAPRHLFIFPAYADGVVNAVIELGFFESIDQRVHDLLDQVASSIGIALRSAHFRAQLQAMLEQTQRQSEELQVQSEELRVSNEELEEQGRALKEQQARLEQQQVELEQTNSQLEEQAQTLETQRDELELTTQSVQLKARELEQASQYKSDFLANMSHELRTPLNSLLILSKLLGDNGNGNLTDEQVKYAKTIQSSGNDLLALINDILDLSKIEAGHIQVQLQSLAIKDLVSDLTQLFQPIADERHLSFEIEVAGDCPAELETDRQRLEQILKNLLSNAFKFTERGGVKLQLSRAANADIAFAVVDTGIGISPDQQQAVFEAFRQADGTISRRYGGTGLGLSISRELARLLGGIISLKSRPGAGSTFTVTIPAAYDPTRVPERVTQRAPSLATPETAQLAPVQPASNQPQRTPPVAFKRVADDRDTLSNERRLLMVIEDDDRFAEIVRDLAREMNFQCVVARTAQEALELARRLKPSAVVLDVGLPDQSGLTVLDRLKRDDQTRHIPIHVISASDHSQAALSMGAVGYLVKPVMREALAEVLQTLESKLTRTMRRVLIVEDDAVQRDAVAKLLASREVETVGVGTAAACIAALNSEVFDCVVLDLSLPDASGFSVLETLSKDGLHSFPPVIVYTGRDLSADEETRLRRYSSSIIIKGAKSPERLLDEVSLFLHQVVSELPAEHQQMIQKARNRDAVLEGRRILIVEDDVRNIYSLTSVLEPRGAHIQIARNGQEALDALDGSATSVGTAIDLVLMDVMMPIMDGLVATRKIRADERWSKLPIVMLTAKAMPDDQEKCLEAGANDYMAKPIDVDKLLSLVRVWMPR